MEKIEISLEKVNFTKSYRNNKINVLLLHIPQEIFKYLDSSIEVLNHTLHLRDDFHITIIGNNHGEKIIEYIENQNLNETDINFFMDKLLLDIKNIIQKTDIFLEDKFYVLRKEYLKDGISETRISVIQSIRTQVIDEVFNLLLNKYKIKLESDTPKPHITLYKQKENFGIGLYKKDDLTKYAILELNSLGELY